VFCGGAIGGPRRGGRPGRLSTASSGVAVGGADDLVDGVVGSGSAHAAGPPRASFRPRPAARSRARPTSTAAVRPGRRAAPVGGLGRSGLSRRGQHGTAPAGRPAAGRYGGARHSCMLAGSARCTSLGHQEATGPAGRRPTPPAAGPRSNTRSPLKAPAREDRRGRLVPRPSRAAMSGASPGRVRPASSGVLRRGRRHRPRAQLRHQFPGQVASGRRPADVHPGGRSRFLAPGVSPRAGASSATRRVLADPASPGDQDHAPVPGAAAAVQAVISVRSLGGPPVTAGPWTPKPRRTPESSAGPATAPVTPGAARPRPAPARSAGPGPTP